MVRRLLILTALLLLSTVFAIPVTGSGAPQSTPGEANKLCLECHSIPNRQITLPSGESLSLVIDGDMYAQSLHGQHDIRCIDCHTNIAGYPHPPLKANDYRDFQFDRYRSCFACHSEQYQGTLDSIHAQALAGGNREAAICTDCHGAHDVSSPNEPRQKISLTCSQCHAAIFEQYRHSVHGAALSEQGNPDVPTCVDCHMTHDILKPINPKSSVNPANVAGTCAQCHKKGATEKFALSYDHKASLKSGNIINYYVRISYIWLILLVIGGMFVHNMLIYLSNIVRKYRERKDEKLFPRLTKGQMIIHGVNFLAFFTLVVTGFSLRFSDVPVLHMLTLWLSEGARSLIHRIAGVTMILVFAVHFFRIARGKADRGVFTAMLPRLKDIRDFKDNMKYIFLRTDKRPRYGKTTYAEKMEYLALLWGTAVMALTGLILWFPIEALKFLPAWSIKVAESIHFYEAILATMAIFFWHFFFVILHPDVYPLDLTVVDGKMPVEEIKEQRPDWYDELKEKGKID